MVKENFNDNNTCHDYTVEGIKFVVTPVFHKNGNETVKTILTKLIKAEIETKTQT